MVRGGEETNRWSDIQRELLEEILQKLTLVDYLKCRRVCRSWRNTVDDAVATKGQTCAPAPQFPFLMLLPHNRGSFDIPIPPYKPAVLSDITQEDNSYTIPTQTWNRCFEFDSIFSAQGWLVFEKVYYKKNQNYDLILFSNPVSGEEFELPHLPLFPGQDFTRVSVRLVFSSSPNTADFLVVASVNAKFPQQPQGHQWKQQLSFCKVTDKSWTLIPTHESRVRFHKFVILDWKLYAISTYMLHRVTLFNLKDSNIIASEKLELQPIPNTGNHEFTQYMLARDEFTQYMLARDGDEILLVLHHSQISGTRTNGFCVFKLDMCAYRWTKVDDLGDRVLLMDYAGIQVSSTKEINLPEKFNGDNCVCFCITSRLRNVPYVKRDLGVFSLKDKRVRSFPLSPSLQVNGCQCLWFMPSL